jgi:hypothetical protein
LLQLSPLQQSEALKHGEPLLEQAHFSAAQEPEQQPPGVTQGLPNVSQPQAPPLQVPTQQSTLSVHARPAGMQQRPESLLTKQIC